MKKNFGILGILLVVFIATAIGNPNFLTAYNMFNLLERASLYGIIGIGVAFVPIHFQFSSDSSDSWRN